MAQRTGPVGLPDNEHSGDAQEKIKSVKQSGEENADQSPEVLQEQIEQTRAEMSATIDAIQDRLDPARIRVRMQQELYRATMARVEPAIELARMTATTWGKMLAEAGDAATQQMRRLRTAQTTQLGELSPAAQDESQDTAQPVAARVRAVLNSTATISKDRLQPVGRALQHQIEERPVPAALVSLAVGVVVGKMLPARGERSAECDGAIEMLIETPPVQETLPPVQPPAQETLPPVQETLPPMQATL